MRKITNWNRFDWKKDGDERLDLWVETKHLPVRESNMRRYIENGETEAENMKFPAIANAIILYEKENEVDPEMETAKGFRGKYDAHTRYILGKNAKTRKERIARIKTANARKRFFGNDAYIIISRFEGKEKPFFKETRIMECSLIERQHRDRREGKKICRQYCGE